VSLDEIDVERTCLCTRTIGSQKSDNAGSGLSDRLGGQPGQIEPGGLIKAPEVS